MSRKRSSKKRPKLAVFLLLLALIIIAAAVAVYFIKPEIFHKAFGLGSHEWGEWQTGEEATCTKEGKRFRTCKICDQREEESYKAEHSFGADGVCTVCGFDGNIYGTTEEAALSDFSVHVIDLGQYAGDSIYIKAGQNDILIDAGSRAASATLIRDYLGKYVTDGKLEYVVATHADQDHIAAFAGNVSKTQKTGVLYNYEVDTLIRFDNVKNDKKGNEDNESTVYGKFIAACKYLKSRGTDVFTAGECYREENGAKRQYFLDEEHTLSLNILYNYYYDNVSSDENNHSVVTLFTKQTSAGKINYLFTGDLEGDGESRLVDYYSNPANSRTEYDVLPDVEFFKAGHHGSGTSSSEKLLQVIKPEYVAISCCTGAPEYTKNNSNTFPYAVTLKNLLRYTGNVYCTGLATSLPELSGGVFKDDEWEYSPLCGNIVFYLKYAADGSAKSKLTCSAQNITIYDTDWYKNYRGGQG